MDRLAASQDHVQEVIPCIGGGMGNRKTMAVEEADKIALIGREEEMESDIRGDLVSRWRELSRSVL